MTTKSAIRNFVKEVESTGYMVERLDFYFEPEPSWFVRLYVVEEVPSDKDEDTIWGIIFKHFGTKELSDAWAGRMHARYKDAAEDYFDLPAGASLSGKNEGGNYYTVFSFQMYDA